MHGRSGGYDSMIDFFEKTKGSISLFLALIMLPMMTVAGLIVDGARISAAKASLSGAGDLAMNAALSEYDQILYDVYGIFAVSENMEELQNNVSRYFANSIDNTGILNDSDSYTREFINSIFSSFSGDEMEFNNIVDLKADRFTLQGVESSAIGNPKVLERQIVDYMKYRGPINIGKGLLTKLGCIGETSKQTKAIEAKVNYDQKLDTVQDACKEAYKAINEYNDLIGGNSKFASNEYLNQLSQDIDSAKKDVADMVKYLVAYNSSELNVPPLINERPSSLDSLRVIILKDQWAIFKVDSATRKEVESYGDKFKSSLEQKITEGGNQAKEKIKDEISSFTAGIAGDSAGSSGSAAAASGLTMNYKEYVKTFIMIHLLMGDGSKNAMLTRTAQLIQANVQQQSSGFDVTKAFTVVTATAEVSVRTTFFQVPVTTVHADNETSYELDFSRIGTGYQKLKYSSVLGY